ncbi:MAG: outer membrane protein transport protein [Myxococcales bacterium]|nr:outer membrane protein transport protein [Myxococcales bacterium]
MRTLVFVTILAAGAAHAAGFALDTHGARATGMATAVASQIDDASAAFYNPAGLAQGKRLELMLGDTLILPTIQVVGPSGTPTTISGMSPPPHLFAAYGITEELSAGLGVFAPFGASSKWPADWEGRQRTLVSSLQVFTVNPELAYRPHESVRAGVGLQVVRSAVVLERGTDFVDSTGTVTLGGATWGTGFNAGVQATVVPELLSLGVSYRSPVTLAFAGGVQFTGVPVELSSRMKDQGVSTQITLPDVVMAGVSSKPMKGLTVAFDVNYFAWSKFQELAFTFDDPDLNSSLQKRWRDTINFHLGAEYAVSDELQVRIGGVFDPTPSPADTLTPDIPDADRIKVAAGAGYRFDAFAADLGYQLVLLNSTTSTSPFFPATYSGMAHVLGLTLSYRN